MRPRIFLFCTLILAVFALAYRGYAQRAPHGKVQSLQATSDKAGAHPATATITGPATVTCLSAVSETPNVQPPPACRIAGPGFSGILVKGKTANLTGPGDVTLTCSGQGFLRCDARVDIPPPTK
jgi:hypothetical protein